MLTGENGLLSKTEEAQEENRKGTAREKVELAILASWDEQGEFNKEQLKKEIQNQGGSIVKEEEKKITIEMDEYLFVVDVTVGKITEVRMGTIFIDCEVTPDESSPAPSRNIKIKACGKNQIVGIKLPNSETWMDTSEAEFEATENGDYSFVVKDSSGGQKVETVSIGNVISNLVIYQPSQRDRYRYVQNRNPRHDGHGSRDGGTRFPIPK